MIRLFLFILFFFCLNVYAQPSVMDEWKLKVKQPNYIVFENSANFSKFVLRKLDIDKNISIKKTTIGIMEKLNGRNIRPVPKIKGWSFVYVDNNICTLIVHKNKNSYYMISLCGQVPKDQVKELYLISLEQI